MTLNSVENLSIGKYEKPNLKGDRLNVLLLIYMYILQCLPRSMSNAIVLILQNRKVTYEEQAEFSLVPTTYTFKLLWAPIIDCIYWKRMGRRKTWAISMQYLAGALMLFASFKMDDWIGTEGGSVRPSIHWLTATFFLCSMFSSMQDVAVDGWALTMLQKRNVGQSGTCNNVGFAFGQFFGYISFICLGSKEFCNYFRAVPQEYGLIQFDDFMLFWAIVIMTSTTLIFKFKRDNSLDMIENHRECKLGLIGSYKRLYKIVKLRPIQRLCLIMMSCLFFFGPINGVVPLKLMDAGVPRDKFVLTFLPTLPALCIFPFLLDGYLTKHKALDAFLRAIMCRLIFTSFYAAFVYFTPSFKNESNTFSAWYYGALLLIYNIDQAFDYAIWITGTAFTNHVSDARFAAMYATLFNTMMQIGNKWSNTLCIRLVDLLTFKTCVKINDLDEVCTVKIDGFYTEIVLFTIFGFLWLYWARREVLKLKTMNASAFKVKDRQPIVKDKLLPANDDCSLQKK